MNIIYYQEMLRRGRLLPFHTRNRMIGFISFFIGEETDKNKFVRDDMWQVLDDNSEGQVCFIDQAISDKCKDNVKFSFNMWHQFKKYIKETFHNVKYIHWQRWDRKTNEVRIYKKEL